MGLADDLALVLAIDGLHPLLADNVDVLLGSGLAAAGDAAAGTSHDLDEVVGRGPFADLVHQLPGAGIPAGHGDLPLEALGGLPLWLYVLQLDGGLLHLLQAYNGRDMEVGEGQLPAGDDLIHRTQCSLHHAAGDTEDVRRAGGEAQGGVKLLLR